MGLAWAVAAALGVLIVFSVIAYLALRARAKAKREGAEGKKGLPGGFWWWLVIGQDGRVSTSKLQVALWSYAVAFAILTVLLVDLDLGDGFQLQNEYLLLLGSPAAAAILAKGITSGQVDEGAAPKPEVERNESRGLVQGLGDVVSDDEGRLEIFDLQYFLFTLVALAVFLVEFFSTRPPESLPSLPWTLVGLTSVSAGGYVGKKLAEDLSPVLTALSPGAAPPGESVTVYGRNLVIANPDGTDVRPERVKFGGREVGAKEGFSASRLEAEVPSDLRPGETVEVKVLRSDGVETGGLDFRVTGGPSIVSVRPTRIVFDSGNGRLIRRRENASDKEIIISGEGFGEVRGDGGGAAVLLDGRPLEATDNGWHRNLIRAKLPSFEQAKREGYAVPGTAELVVHDADGRSSEPYPVVLAQSRAGRGRNGDSG